MPSQGAGYAAGTEVAAARSRAEIERVLEKAGGGGGAGTFYFWTSPDGQQMRFTIPLPDRSEARFTHDGRHRRRTEPGMRAAYDGEIRRLWRSVLLMIKAKLEAVNSGITSIEEEFLAHVVLPDGSTVGQWSRDQLKAVYGGGQMPALLPGSDDR